MPGLTTSLLMATQALMAQQGAINATANNIANMNTPGYSRQEVILTEGTPMMEGNIQYGSGVVLEGFKTVRDKLLELRIGQETQQKGYADSLVSALQQVEALFTDSKNGIGGAISSFFTSLQSMSSSQGSTASRSAVLTAAQNLATAFNSTDANLKDIQSNLNLQVAKYVNSVNTLTQQIADLNIQVAQLKANGTDPSTLEDQQTQLTKQLSELIDVNVVQTEQGDTLTTGNGTPLVVGGMSFALEAQGSGTLQVFAQGNDITQDLKSGKLGAALEIRDQFIPNLASDLNSLATSLATAFNTAHKGGYDLSGTTNADFFSATSAANFTVLITDPAKIAASNDSDSTATGDLGNIANLLAARASASGSSVDALYSSMIFKVGNATAQAESQATTADLSLRQLQDQREALSGVSINEETANLLRYQHAFQAAAKVISAIDEMTKIIINIGA